MRRNKYGLLTQTIDRILSGLIFRMQKMRIRIGEPTWLNEAVSNHAVLIRAISTLVELNLVEILSQENISLTQIAAASKSEPTALKRLLDFLGEYGVIDLSSDKTYRLSKGVRNLLQSGTEQSMNHWIQYASSEWFWNRLAQLGGCIKTGESSFRMADSKDYFCWLQENPHASEQFNRAMLDKTKRNNRALLSAYDFSKFENIVDIAGGHGGFIIDVLRLNPKMKGILFDQAHVIEEARSKQAPAALEPKITMVPGSFLESIPQGGDLYILRHILHNWSDSDAERILSNCRSAMQSKSKLLVIDMLVNQEAEFNRSILAMDLVMLILFGSARERTSQEFSRLLQNSGFKVNRIVSTGTPLFIIEAQAA